MTSFHDLGLDPLLLKVLDAEGYTTPTPIQAQAIPPVLQGRDLVGIAQTGTGKTAAFALPILQRLAANSKPPMRKGVRALVLSPTRELATQIGESFKTYGRSMGLSVAVVFGGVGHKPQRDQLSRGVDILVATPGRLIDHMNERNVILEGTEILVLDEADQMMDLGFIRPLRQIISKLSHRRQSLFFSATMPQEIGSLAAELLRDPVKVSVTPIAKTADRVAQEVIFVEQTKKRSLLVELFTNPDLKRAIVFTRTKRGADRVARHLDEAGIKVAAIHGNKSQGQRDAALGGFKSGRIRALIATDIAARGIDVDAVSHVINYEIPNVPESYVHRIGRTARAGAEGIAISLVDQEERAYLRDIERLTRQQIPSKDRRGDKSLAAAPNGRGEAVEDDRRSEGRRGPRAGRPVEGRGPRQGSGPGGAHSDGGARTQRSEDRGRGERSGPAHQPSKPHGPRRNRDHGANGASSAPARANAGRAEGASRDRSREGDHGAAQSGGRRSEHGLEGVRFLARGHGPAPGRDGKSRDGRAGAGRSGSRSGPRSGSRPGTRIGQG